jgi:hypothetical protein
MELINGGRRAAAGTALVLVLASAGAFGGEWTGNFHMGAGPKRLGSEWQQTNNHTNMSAQFDLRRRGWPMSLFLEGSHSESGAKAFALTDPSGAALRGTLESSTQELAVGARKVFEPTRRLRLFAGAGPTLLQGGIKVKAANQALRASGSGIGGWADVGAYLTLWERVNVGLRGRWSYGEVDLAGTTLRAGGPSAALQAGYHF